MSTSLLAAGRTAGATFAWARRRDAEGPARLALLAFIALVVLAPLGQLLLALLEAGPAALALLAPDARAPVLRATRHSLEVGLGGTLIATLLGLLLATLVSLVRLRWRQGLVFAFVLQAMLPPQVVALAWLQLWLPLREALLALGWSELAGAANPLQTRWGIMALLGVHYAPLVFLTVRAGLLNVPPDVIEAARTCGAGPWRVVTRVLWPLITPALAAGAALAFVSCIGNFGIPAFLGIPGDYLVLPTLIYQELAGFGSAAIPRATALAALVAALAAAGMLLQQRYARRGHYRVLSRRMPHPPYNLGRAEPWLMLPLLGLALLLLGAPLLALLAKSLSPAPGVPLSWDGLSLQHYRYVLWDNEATLRALRNSLGLSLGAALVLALASVLLAYQLEYRRHRLLAGLTRLLEFAYVIPGVVLAMAMILLYLKPLPLLGVSLYNTVWIIFLAYLARFFTLQLRPVLSGLQQIPRELLEAAEVFGAGFLRRLWRVLLPLLAPAVSAGALLTLLLAMNELTVSALLWASGSETLGVLVFGLEQGGESAAAAALGVIGIALTLALMLLASLCGRRLPAGVLPWRA
ncbi:iron ABC transporter permease [Roseateles sp. DAIF2]|uniref:ABC transporter permease n=1 Tax=Roseateles sp. DAIF2 TaxID=2714952 RepID=UPI0018A2AFDE|nr:ABC transporter permease subunit [Roseateles sp. DAIF2]QPF76071.1 iron ABC transporter permease [Roseateles sp. DAIF2]